jgi:hypothetical protein
LKGGKKEVKMKTVRVLFLSILVVIAITLYLFNPVSAVVPFGANYSGEVTTTAPADSPQSHTALAGNVTYLTLTGFTTTQAWQGYYGNVSGTVQLADGANKVLYNWSLASPSGEVYASENGTGAIAWVNVTCYNFTGNYSTGGARLAKLETRFNISTDDVDGVNETFSDGNSHDGFYTANRQFTTGQCPAAYMFNGTGISAIGNYEEVLLTDASDDVQVIFTALLEENNKVGFDGKYYDFEMIVLENGHGTDTNSRDYYFYVELE